MRETLKHLQAKYNKLGLSRTELVQELGISIATLDRMLARGDDLPRYTKVGRQYFFLLSDIAAFLDGNGAEVTKKEEPG